MKNFLILGASGNVGKYVIEFLMNKQKDFQVLAAVRNLEAPIKEFRCFENLKFKNFDFQKPDTWKDAFENIDTLFLLRPPALADIKKIFLPLLETAKMKKINKIVFLSVQGADKKTFIPHAKIEKIIKENNFEYIFLRPSYFMQNLTTTLKEDFYNGTIKLPCKNAKFNWIDAKNVGEIAAHCMINFEELKNNAYDITSDYNLSFKDTLKIINRALNTNIKFENVNLLNFYRHKRKQNTPMAMILVMIMLHFFPRFEKEPKISNLYRRFTGKEATNIKEFALRDIFLRK